MSEFTQKITKIKAGGIMRIRIPETLREACRLAYHSITNKENARAHSLDLTVIIMTCARVCIIAKQKERTL